MIYVRVGSDKCTQCDISLGAVSEQGPAEGATPLPFFHPTIKQDGFRTTAKKDRFPLAYGEHPHGQSCGVEFNLVVVREDCFANTIGSYEVKGHRPPPGVRLDR